MNKLTFERIAELTLERTGKALTIQEIWSEANRLNIIGDFKSKGKTPWATIGAYIYWSLKERDSPFVQVSKKPALFGHKKYYGRNSTINYYVVGSKYRDNQTEQYTDIFPELVERNVISVGFADWIDLTDYYLRPQDEIGAYLYAQGLKVNDVTSLKKFLTIKKDDLIAIKSHGRYGKLKIIAYARVVEDAEGKVYKYDPGGLSHLLNVDFLETDVERHLELNKGLTIHEIKEPNEIKKIFGWYEIAEISKNSQKLLQRHSSTSHKNVDGHIRKGIASVFVRAVHNELQQMFYRHLNAQYPGKVRMEENFVDVLFIEGEAITLYEIKPYSDPIKCVREALGQLLYYAVKHYPNSKKNLVVVGPFEPDGEQKKIIELYSQSLNIPFKYLSFNREGIA